MKQNIASILEGYLNQVESSVEDTPLTYMYKTQLKNIIQMVKSDDDMSYNSDRLIDDLQILGLFDLAQQIRKDRYI